MMLAAACVFGMELGGAVTASTYDSGTPHGPNPVAGRWECFVCLFAVRAAGGGMHGGWLCSSDSVF